MVHRDASLLCVHLSGSHLLTDCCCFLRGCQDNASKLLLALMESRHDSENAERILFNLRPRELVRAPILYNWVLKLRIKAAVNNLCSIHNVCVCVCAQVEVIKKAYNQESEEGEGEVSPREVGHNIYILAQQVTSTQAPHWLTGGLTLSSENEFQKYKPTVLFVCSQLARHNKILQNLLKPPKKSKEGDEGISSMVNPPSIHPSIHQPIHPSILQHLLTFCCFSVCSWTWTTVLCPRCWSLQLQLLWWSRTHWSTTTCWPHR